MLGFLYRLCGDDLRTAAPWSLPTLLERYRTLDISCKTILAVRAHAHWINVLLRCPGFGNHSATDNVMPLCTVSRLRPLLNTTTPPPPPLGPTPPKK